MGIADLVGRMDAVEHRMDSIEQRLDASFASLSTQILQSRRETNEAILATRTDLFREIAALRSEFSEMRAATMDRFETLETALGDGLDETRRFMRILYEDALSRIALIGEGRPPS
jgi:hypothetical protein